MLLFFCCLLVTFTLFTARFVFIYLFFALFCLCSSWCWIFLVLPFVFSLCLLAFLLAQHCVRHLKKKYRSQIIVANLHAYIAFKNGYDCCSALVWLFCCSFLFSSSSSFSPSISFVSFVILLFQSVLCDTRKNEEEDEEKSVLFNTFFLKFAYLHSHTKWTIF